jgi:ribosomal protein S18 acetylase RimI-like enzyme
MSDQPEQALIYKPASGEQYDLFLDLMRSQAADYLDRTMELMGMTQQDFAHLFRTVGQVYGVYEEGRLAGFYWIEEREEILHLHGLVLEGAAQGQGIGSRVLTMLETTYRDSMEAIELGVHESNERARRLYERLGYRTVKLLDDVGFFIMHKPTSSES